MPNQLSYTSQYIMSFWICNALKFASPLNSLKFNNVNISRTHLFASGYSHCIECTTFVHLSFFHSFHEHLNFYHRFVTTNNATVNILVHVSLGPLQKFSDYISRIVLAGLGNTDIATKHGHTSSLDLFLVLQ